MACIMNAGYKIFLPASSIRRFFLRKIRHFAKILFYCLYWIDTVRTTSYHYGKITQRRNVG